MLEMRNISAAYGNVGALHDVSLNVKEREFIGLLGSNNAGKTTLINCLSGIVPITSGLIVFDGHEISRLRADQVVELGLIQVAEGRLLFPNMTVRENLLLGGVSKRARAARKSTMDQVLTLFPRLGERLDQVSGTMSGGEQQMLAIGRGLMALPRILMLDEPSLGVAPLVVKIIFEALATLNRDGMTIFVVEQNLNLTLRYAQRCYVLERGKVAIEGRSEEVKNHPGTRKAYLGL